MFFGKKPPPPSSGKPTSKSKWLAEKENVWKLGEMLNRKSNSIYLLKKKSFQWRITKLLKCVALVFKLGKLKSPLSQTHFGAKTSA
jgi:hypothetical protein